MTGKVDPLFANHPDIMAMEQQTRRFVDGFRAQANADLDALHQKENQIAMLMADNIRLRRSEVSIDLMRRVWANLYFNEKEAGNTFQQTLIEVVDWLAARNALPDWDSSPTSPLSPSQRHRVGVTDDG